MEETFDIKAFESFLKIAYAGFVDQSMLYEDVGGRLVRSHIVEDGAYSIGLSQCFAFDYHPHKVSVKCMFNDAMIVLGEFDLHTCMFHLDIPMRDNHLGAVQIVESHLKAYTKDIVETLSKRPEVPLIDVCADDVVKSLKENLECYMKLTDESTEKVSQEVCTRSNTIEAQITYVGLHGVPGSMFIEIQYKTSIYEKCIYMAEYNCGAGEFRTEMGEVPNGFDDGFGAFRLLGSLIS